MYVDPGLDESMVRTHAVMTKCLPIDELLKRPPIIPRFISHLSAFVESFSVEKVHHTLRAVPGDRQEEGIGGF